jgi:hypothetical protein
MRQNPLSRASWWLLFLAAALLLPLLPTASILAVGWLLPGQIEWFYADASVPIGPLLSASAIALLVSRATIALALHLVCFVVAIYLLSCVARMELVFAKACVTQRGVYIDFQQQQQEIKGSEESCG